MHLEMKKGNRTMPRKGFELDEIEELGLMLKAAMREAERRLNDLLRPLGLTTGQAEVLQLLERCGPMSLGELGALLVAEGGHPSRLVDRMVRAGYVIREEAAEDRRRITLQVSKHGLELAKGARESKKEFRKWMSEQLKDVDIEAARSFFAAYLTGTELEKTVAQRKKTGALA
jgi:MarR family transcriptional regulator, organic hydroperoxide resistance regulator